MRDRSYLAGVVALGLALFLGACSLHNWFSAEGPMVDIEALPKPPEDKVLVVVYRPANFVGSIHSLDIRDGLQMVTELPNAGAFFHLREPGRFTVWTELRNEIFVNERYEASIIAEAGQTYFIRVAFEDDIKPDAVVGARTEVWLSLSLVERERALAGLGSCHILSGSYGLPNVPAETPQPEITSIQPSAR